jgi:hypothetical protein
MAEKIDTAADVEAAKAKLADAEAAHAKAVEEAAENRKPPELIVDLLDAIVMRLGNRPEMRAMVASLKKQIEPTPAPEEQ